MEQQRRVVVTGAGVVSPIGIGVPEYAASMAEGRSGVRTLSWLAGSDMPVQIGAEVCEFEPKQYVRPRKSLKVMSREIQIGFAAANLAVQDAGLETETLDADRFGVVYGSEMLYCPAEELRDVFAECMGDDGFDVDRWGSVAMREIFPLWMLKYLPNMTACHVGIALDARGPNNTITLGEASALLACQEAVQVIERGHADVMIAGASGTRLALTPWLHREMDHMSCRNTDPAGACRPFDADRDGIVNGEGGAALVLESAEFAQARGARVMANIRGGANTFGGPDEDSRQRAIERSIVLALRAAETESSAVGHVNASAGGHRRADIWEARAIRATLGDVPVTAPKSYFGNLGAACGVVELIASLQALDAEVLPATLNYQKPDPECPVNVVAQPCASTRPSALILSQSGTGQSAALVLDR